MRPPDTPDPIEAQVRRWFRDADLAHPAVRLLFDIAMERRRARNAAESKGRR